jgi:hypothetical protein
MQLVDTPNQLPGVCICCKGGTQRQCVDTHQNIGNWRVYVCSQCALEMAELFGFAAGKDLSEAEGKIQSLQHALEDAEVALADAVSHQVRVVSVDDVVPYVKKQPGRPRNDGADPEAAEVAQTA